MVSDTRIFARFGLDCGDSACRYATSRGGMRTNGGCTCHENLAARLAALEAVVEAARHVKRGLPDWESDDWANSGFPALERALAAYDKARSG